MSLKHNLESQTVNHAQAIKSIAVFRMSALGDCILVSAAVSALRKAFPETKIFWIVDKDFIPLFTHLEGVEFIGIKKPVNLEDYWRLKQLFRELQFDILLAMQSSFRANVIYPLIQAKRKIGFDSVRGREGHSFFVNEQIRYREEHLLDGFFAFVEYLAPHVDLKAVWGFNIDQGDKQWVQSQLGNNQDKVLVLNPAASKVERCCTPDFYRGLLEALQKHFSVIVLTGGPASWEIELAAEIENLLQLEVPLVNLVGKTSLRQLFAIVDVATVFISPDTGPIHIADALGKKVVGLYAIARPALTGPYQNLQLVADCYPIALHNLRGKKVSEVSWSYRIHDPRAMSFFQLDELESLVQKALL